LPAIQESLIKMKKILIVDDDDAMRRLMRLNLEDEYEIVDTGEPENALALALRQKPDIILLDLRMPSYSGYELCQTFSSFNSTQLIPVFVISGEVGGKTKELCQKLGASAFFEKPVNFDRLRTSIAEYLKTRRLERRSEARVHLRVAIKLRATEEGRTVSSSVTTTENVGRNSFWCACALQLANDSVVDVFLLGPPEEHAGKARVKRTEGSGTEYPKYALRFDEKPTTWVLN
jgi:response regulator RpfG family c-di-GMP phosphodiesterase